jgi:hypothetical protein
MPSFSQLCKRSWDVVVAVAAAAVAARWLTPTVINGITTEIIAFFSIQSAVILPAMIFTAGILRSEGLTVPEVERYQYALRRQMHFWVFLLSLDFLAVAVVIIGKAADWKWKITVSHWSADFGWVLVALTVLFGALAVLRMVPFIGAVMSLMDLNAWMVKKAIEARNREVESKSAASVSDFKPPQGFGRITRRRKRG